MSVPPAGNALRRASRTARWASWAGCITLAVVPSEALAQSAGVRSVTLTEALRQARATHPSVQASERLVAVREAEAAMPRSQWLPRVGATVQGFIGSANNTTALSVGTSVVGLPRIGATRSHDLSGASWTPYGSTLAAVGISQEVYDFGRIAAQASAADAATEVARHGAQATWLDVELAVREAFYAVQAAHAVLTTAEGAYQRALAHRDLARAWVDQNLRPRIELERSEAELARADVGRIRAAGGLESAMAVLAAAVGVPTRTLDAAGDTDAGDTALPELDSALRTSEARDPRMREALGRIREQALQTRAIAAELRPDVGATATLSGRSGGAPPTSGEGGNGSGALPVVPNWDVGVVVSIPLVDATVDARRRASERTEEALNARARVVRQTLVAEVESAWMAVRLALAAVPALTRAAVAARANQELADARFRAGLGAAIELADAETLRTDAEIQVALGALDLARARARFAHAIAEDR